jgi:hypothetical protein
MSIIDNCGQYISSYGCLFINENPSDLLINSLSKLINHKFITMSYLRLVDNLGYETCTGRCILFLIIKNNYDIHSVYLKAHINYNFKYLHLIKD